ncbi:CPBP family glutamic-type intramembrane protease [Streptococcus mutans]|uniref:CPBP family intramembrane glutamic endopeptidase n=1 Tax=Streptococcus mutans TaxID=1309 RepID=UPI0028E45421|nr:CPBP family intramembrane glutamic endopeptidase [Streptococcus mutans]MDT9552721.1 CPBP family glutamic-type intramembrane protease [Streptococcus mutans]MDT9572662.1 CPBP family glutamic-type intramembrane protease [Streptococcus mutans]
MDLLVSKLMVSGANLVLFITIPFITWMVVGRKTASFLNWVGLKKIQRKLNRSDLFIILGALAVTLLAGPFGINLLKNINGLMPEGASMGTFEFSGRGVSALPAILVQSLFNTSLLEEVFFRGFLLKRFSNRLGFALRNTTQALLFGLMHSIFLFLAGKVILAIIITLFTGLFGWFSGYITEKKFAGSILPSWCIHGVGNVISNSLIAFSLL